MKHTVKTALLAAFFAVSVPVVADAASPAGTSVLYDEAYKAHNIVIGNPYPGPTGAATIRLKYREWYRPDSSAVLLQLSGMQSHSQWFNESGDYFHSLGYNVYALDRRGSGFSKGVRGHVYTPFQWIADLAQVIGFIKAKNPGKPVHIMANSFGARIAMTYAELYPDTIASLILDAPATHMLVSLPAPEMIEVQFQIRDRHPTPLRDALFTVEPDKLAFMAQDAAGLREITANIYKMGDLLNTGNLIAPSLRQLTMPVLVLVSMNDKIVDARAMISGLYNRLETQKKLVTYHDVEHYLLFSDRSAEVQQEIGDWIATAHPAAARRSAAAVDPGDWIASMREELAQAGVSPEPKR